jgi:hypothetical protein
MWSFRNLASLHAISVLWRTLDSRSAPVHPVVTSPEVLVFQIFAGKPFDIRFLAAMKGYRHKYT